ncbi:MAG: uracil-DNA glycosylase [Phenylobacterium sp.]|uniref:uracil-DNA glycosylase n=1 Tax=Phenylobacterium sp. TaxID=1871053 RepID=UPI0025F4C345|nr:uracil-DNA glycosylase [Phenylobacterium sp.]MBI1199457.1 uracil-DNA glycosylase [Phenylobacterium sp.]
MPPAADGPDSRLAESLLAFWADAGVDAMLLDAPLDRIEAGKIAPPPRPAPIAAPVAPVARAGQPDISGAVAQAKAAAAAAADLDALVAAIAAFEGCPLRFEGAATKAVVYRGDPQAPVMVIGEGPGAEEDIQGKPFVGRAGKLLDRMVAAAGLEDRVFITNTVFWRPPGNRTPTPAEQAVCAPFLERIIALVRPKMLLLAGGASAKSLLKREEGILSMRGRWFEWRASDGAMELPAMPTLHPAFLLRQPGAKKRAWADLLTLTERLDRPERPH